MVWSEGKGVFYERKNNGLFNESFEVNVTSDSFGGDLIEEKNQALINSQGSVLIYDIDLTAKTASLNNTIEVTNVTNEQVLKVKFYDNDKLALIKNANSPTFLTKSVSTG